MCSRPCPLGPFAPGARTGLWAGHAFPWEPTPSAWTLLWTAWRCAVPLGTAGTPSPAAAAAAATARACYAASVPRATGAAGAGVQAVEARARLPCFSQWGRWMGMWSPFAGTVYSLHTTAPHGLHTCVCSTHTLHSSTLDGTYSTIFSVLVLLPRLFLHEPPHPPIPMGRGPGVKHFSSFLPYELQHSTRGVSSPQCAARPTLDSPALL